MKHKTLIILGLVAVVLAISVIAYEPIPKGTCAWTRPATEYRPERTFMGIYGRLSDGSISCFLPGRSHTKPKAKINPFTCNDVTTCDEAVCETTQTCEEYAQVEVCEEPVCEEVCTTEKVKVWKETCWYDHKHKKHCSYGWVWEDKETCEDECAEPVCHFEQGECLSYSEETTCADPVCTTKQVCN